MKKLIILLLMVLPLGVFAQELKIAVVNSQDVMMQMPEIKSMQETLKQMNDQFVNEMKTMNDEYEKKYSAYISQQDSLTENIKLKRMQDISDIQQRMENFSQVARQDMDKKQQELLAPIQEKLRNAIKAVGDEKGYTYMLDSASGIVVYTGNTAVDATPFVKAKLGLQ